MSTGTWRAAQSTTADPSRTAGRSVAEAQVVPAERECSGNSGLCGVPLGPGQTQCARCSDVPIGASESLQRQVAPPDRPECPGCRRPIPADVERCAWCAGQTPTTLSVTTLRERTSFRTDTECPGDDGACGIPLAPGERRCPRCREAGESTAANIPAAVWTTCRGRDGQCTQLVLPGRGLCLACRRAAGTAQC